MDGPEGNRESRSSVARKLAGTRGAIAVAIVALLGSIAGGGGAASAAGAPASPAGVFALRVLAEATIPPGARPTDMGSCRDRSLTGLSGDPNTGEFTGIIDLRRFYLVDEVPDVVMAYLKSRAPANASKTMTMSRQLPPGCFAGALRYSLAVSGPHDYMASLLYALGAVTGNRTELRVDAASIWLSSRPAAELAPTTGVVQVTGYTEMRGLAFPSSGPVTFTLGRVQAKLLLGVLNGVPLGPRGAGPDSSYGCFENDLVYKIRIRPSRGSPVSFEADGLACDREVVVTVHGRSMQPLYDGNCALAHAVARVLPVDAAQATREWSAACHS